MAKKKPKKASPDAQRQEVDAVKGFIVVMFVLIVALGIFIVITKGQLDDYETAIANSKVQVPKLGEDFLRVQGYLELIETSKETILMNYPNQFFENIYRKPEIHIQPGQVSLSSQKNDPNRKKQYTEIYWNIEIEDIGREQAVRFLHEVETISKKAQALEITMRRMEKRDSPPDSDIWRGDFRVGYRIAGTGK